MLPISQERTLYTTLQIAILLLQIPHVRTFLHEFLLIETGDLLLTAKMQTQLFRSNTILHPPASPLISTPLLSRPRPVEFEISSKSMRFFHERLAR
jgi:hypothetical protein